MPGSVAQLLAAIASRRPVDGGRVAVVVAHPDDETAGCAIALTRLKNVQVVVASDGAPRDLRDAHALGFDCARSYARERRREMLNALSLAGVGAAQIQFLGLADQQLVCCLPELVAKLRTVVTGADIAFVITHAYEGGHPDHDAVALAANLVLPDAVVEMPFYRHCEQGLVFQSFASAGGVTEIVVRLRSEERALKKRMFASYRTQAAILRRFPLEAERFRRAPHYDFRKPANDGHVYYETQPWGTGRKEWDAAVAGVVGC